MKNLKNKNAFSILWLITIVWIFATLSFIIFSYYNISIRNSRDVQRIDDIQEITFWLNNILTKYSKLPKPINWISITSSWKLINSQWFFDNGLVDTNIKYYDPLDLIEYTYSTNKTRDRFQVLWLLENNWSERNSLNFKKRIPYTAWEKLWVFLKEENNYPVQEYLKDSIELSHWVDWYVVYLNNEDYITWENIIKEMNYRIKPRASCLNILKNGKSKWNWIYKIKPNDNLELDVYCDMEMDWWWWTLFYANNWIEDSEISESYVEMRENIFSWNTYSLTNLNEKTLVWMNDYRLFTNNWAKEILITNLASDEKRWWKIFFDSPSTLEWALWGNVLGKWIKKCVDLPEWAYWWMVDENWKNNYENLVQFFTSWWNNWWISHKEYNCNWYKLSVLPHLAFYTANNPHYDRRTRSNTIVWWIWWWENQYRYFIR